MNIAIYARQSKFSESGESIENQVKLCKEYANKLGYTNIKIYKDEGFSGGNINRPEFKQLLEDAKNKEFNCLICYKLDRISRNISDFSKLIDNLNNLNISFISIKEQFDTSTPMGRAMMFISSVFAQLERETIAERIKDNMYELARNGYWLGGNAPLGFKSCKILNTDNNNSKSKYVYKLEPITSNIDTVILIFTKYIEFRSLYKLHKFLLKENIKGPRGGIFDKRTISIILRNPAYVKADNNVLKYLSINGFNTFGSPNNKNGVLTYGKNTTTAIAAIASHQGCIDANLWLKVQYLLDNNKDNPSRLNTSKVALLSGLLKCNTCGKNMGITYSSSKPTYYVCNTKKKLGFTYCDCKNLNSQTLENIIISQIKSIDIEKVISSYSNSKEIIELEKSNINSTISKINNEISEKEKIINSLIIELTKSSGASYYQYIVNQLDSLNKEVLNFKNQIDILELTKKNLSNSHTELDTILNNLNRFNEKFDNSDINLKKELLNDIISKILWDSHTKQIYIHYIGIPTTQQFDYKKSSQFSEQSRSYLYE